MSEQKAKISVTELDIYKEHYAQFRSMNGILYQLPVIFSSIIGALFYFAFSFLERSEVVAIFVLVFSSIVAGMGVVIVHRFGLAFTAYIDSINHFDRGHKISLEESKWPSVITVLKLLLCFSFVMSIGAAVAIALQLI